MKKKMIAVAVLLVAVVVTASQVAGTYAKYTSTVKSSDTARVAKWGINTTNKVDLFKDSYILSGSSAGIKASDTDKVIAPGASGYYTFSISASNAPEVAFKLGVTANITDNTGKIKFFLEKAEYDANTFTEDKESFKGQSDFAGTFAALLGDQEYEPNYTSYADLTGNYTLYWYWDFEDSSSAEQENKTDTYLGNGKDKSSGELGTDYTTKGKEAVKVEVTITAEQIKEKTA